MRDPDGNAVWWLYQARRVNTQTNVGGGALRTIITVPTGQIARIVNIYTQGTASVTSTLQVRKYDEDIALVANLAAVAAGVSVFVELPSVGTAATASGNIVNTVDGIIGPGEQLLIDATVALQNETLTVGIVMLLSTPTIPTWTTTGSAGTPSLAASTISAANTLQAVLM